jgi:5-formyltetrahydrofolate cyclo-ligase
MESKLVASSAASASIPTTMREHKVAIRKEMRASLQKMRERNRRSEQICDAIISHTAWRRSTIVAIFAPMEHEPDVELLWKHADGKTMCYPTIRQGGLDFIGVAGPESVAIGQFGFREPIFDQARVIPPDTFDLVLVPGAAFTANGDRLGRGGGFYDRLLSSPGFRAFKVGVCFDRQVLNEVPVEAHDQRVHRVVTESGWMQRPDFAKKT